MPIQEDGGSNPDRGNPAVSFMGGVGRPARGPPSLPRSATTAAAAGPFGGGAGHTPAGGPIWFDPPRLFPVSAPCFPLLNALSFRNIASD